MLRRQNSNGSTRGADVTATAAAAAFETNKARQERLPSTGGPAGGDGEAKDGTNNERQRMTRKLVFEREGAPLPSLLMRHAQTHMHML
jgi:hypothetical protein